MKQVRTVLQLIIRGYWDGSRKQSYVNDYIDWALSHAPFELLGCE